MKYLRGKLKGWASTRREEDKAEELGWLSELQNFNQREEVAPLSQDHLIQHKELKGKLKKLALLGEIKWKQRSCIQWLKEGDHNTKFIHQMASARQRKNFIHSLEEQGERIDKKEDYL